MTNNLPDNAPRIFISAYITFLVTLTIGFVGLMLTNHPAFGTSILLSTGIGVLSSGIYFLAVLFRLQEVLGTALKGEISEKLQTKKPMGHEKNTQFEIGMDLQNQPDLLTLPRAVPIDTIQGNIPVVEFKIGSMVDQKSGTIMSSVARCDDSNHTVSRTHISIGSQMQTNPAGVPSVTSHSSFSKLARMKRYQRNQALRTRIWRIIKLSATLVFLVVSLCIFLAVIQFLSFDGETYSKSVENEENNYSFATDTGMWLSLALNVSFQYYVLSSLQKNRSIADDDKKARERIPSAAVTRKRLSRATTRKERIISSNRHALVDLKIHT
mmetsp:Transcript_6683/g.16356  ORF Transcript_6683/g.16356 Transcript_6683/m.16356 type:complete len:325 (-) Transcript_6683:141-1115(-)